MTQLGHRRYRRLGSLAAVSTLGALTLAACGGGGDDSGSGNSGDSASGFSFTFPTSTGQESPYETLAKEYSEETGVEIEAKALPNDSYPLTLRTQLQGGNAPDLLVVVPGRGQEHAALPLAEADFLEPLNDDSAGVIPEGSEGLFTVDDQVFAQPSDLVPVGMVWNVGAASDAGVEFPEDSDAMLETCGTAKEEGKSFMALAGSVPPNPGLMAMSISATRVYAKTPDWNAQRAAGDVTFADDEGWQNTLQTVLDMNEGECFQPGAAGGGFDAITQGITQGTSLSAFVPGGAATELMNATPGLELQIQPFPAESGEDPFLLASPNYAFGVNAKSDDAQKQAAQDFLNWLAEPEHAARFTEIEGQVPLTGVEDAELLPQYDPIKDLLIEGNYAPLPNLEWPNPAVYDALATGTQGLLAGRGDIESVLEAMDQAWDK
jgi:raffinose/stachyose/melibiose transport system substrate-binding protein